jgi:uncharacterized protein
MKGLWTILLLTLSNVFMTFAWYGHLKFKEWKPMQYVGIPGVILISWGIAFFEYMLQVPDNRMGNKGNGAFQPGAFKGDPGGAGAHGICGLHTVVISG